MIKKVIKYLFIIVLITTSPACSILKHNTSSIEKCLIVDPLNYNNTRLNPNWIKRNGIKKIIEREYLDGRNGRIHLVTVKYYNKDGYIQTKFSGKGYPKDDSPNETEIFSKWEYTTTHKDSFDFLTYQIIRFFDGQNDLNEPDTLSLTRRMFNVKKAKFYKNEKGKILRTYKYDRYDRLVEELDEKGKKVYNFLYNSPTEIEIEKFSMWFNRFSNTRITLNKQGQIIRNYDDSNEATFEFKYNSKGEMIEEKSWFKNKKPIYNTYEYIK